MHKKFRTDTYHLALNNRDLIIVLIQRALAHNELKSIVNAQKINWPKKKKKPNQQNESKSEVCIKTDKYLSTIRLVL